VNNKQSNLCALAEKLGVNILNIENYQNKDSVLKCSCSSHGHSIEGTVDYLLKTNFECMECLHLNAVNVQDVTPFFLSLDAASYVSGMSLFNRAGQLLGHKTFSIDKKKDFFERVEELRREVIKIATENNIQCIILEDIQYQQNPVLFKKLAMLQGVLRYTIIKELDIDLITAMADEWRSYNHIYGTKRPEQKKAAMERAKAIFRDDIPEDESESIFLGYYGIHQYNNNSKED
jgi:Holliday junction resolvasome RuvABC endonuclease subunit